MFKPVIRAFKIWTLKHGAFTMHPLEAYKKQQQRSMTRIELILTMYGKAFDHLDKARRALAEGDSRAALPFLVNVQMIVGSLASELPAYRDETAVNFLRLYEFVVHQMTKKTVESVDAAEKVLRNLYRGFEAVRDQALALEIQGVIPPLDQPRQVFCKA